MSDGTRAQPEYVDEGVVDTGGMGAIHRVLDREFGRRLAMKVLAPQFAAVPAEVERFFDEARLTGRLDHPNIVPVHALGVRDGVPFFVMKLVEGRTLHERLREPGFTPADSRQLFAVLQILLRTCDALAFAHSRGAVHCDLKPRNVMVGEHGQVYVMDWGIARVLQSATETSRSGLVRSVVKPGDSEVLGTPEYMAPEQAEGLLERLDVRTDVFGLGALLYRVLAGRPPYVGEDRKALVGLAKAGRIVPPWIAQPGSPRALGEIAMKAMARDPADRHQTVAALQADIEAFMRGDVRTESQQIPAGTVLVKEGDAGDAAYVLVEGRCVVFRMVDGRRQILGELGSGAVFGETALFDSQPRTASVEALTSLKVHTITRAFLEDELARTHWVPQLTWALADRFREVNARAARLELEREQQQLSLEIARWIAKKGTGEPRTVPWTSLRLYLCRTFQRSGPETSALVQALPGFSLDLDTDTLALAD